MRLVYFTSGLTGVGRIIIGIAVGNAFRRAGIPVELNIINSSPFAHLINHFGYRHTEIRPDPIDRVIGERYASSVTFRTMTQLNPDVLIVDLWHPLVRFIHTMRAKKIFITRQVDDRYFTMDAPGGALRFDPSSYDRLFAIEPFRSCIDLQPLSPFIIRNRDEIMSRDEACTRLGIDPGGRNCLLALSGDPVEIDRVMQSCAHLEAEGWFMVNSNAFGGRGIFPTVDYFNAFDRLVCGAGYNAYWEARFFDKKADFIPTARTIFESCSRRIAECADYRFERNGADELVGIIMDLAG